MYSLDINFLNDRQERPLEPEPGFTSAAAQQSPLPLYIGLVLGLALPALAGGAWAYLQWDVGRLQARLTDTEGALGAVQAQQAEISQINQQADTFQAEAEALATVFSDIKPWSAILADIRNRTPANVQIVQVQQTEGSGDEILDDEGNPLPTTDVVNIQGRARSFDGVNDFLLLLQRSPFLLGEGTRIIRAQLVADATQIDSEEFEEATNATVSESSLPEVVEYTIEARVTDASSIELLPELEGYLSVGLTSRLETLQDLGVLQP